LKLDIGAMSEYFDLLKSFFSLNIFGFGNHNWQPVRMSGMSLHTFLYLIILA